MVYYRGNHQAPYANPSDCYMRQYPGGFETQLDILRKQYAMLDRRVYALSQRLEQVEKQLGIIR
ncbi:hypothetical protein [Rossellomorea vietnamensis]|uniref:hypothetical protein n=1 Tax=Rossellomorea vietnamensis TaxID=218284 RepID=UPI00308C492D|nr:hypothetical protein Q7C14_10395 [Rossellomorea vietnamensis]